MKRRGKVLTKMIFSYSVMVCIPILISIIVYYYTYGIVQNQANAHNSNLLNVVKSSCDSEIRYYKSILERIQISDTMLELGRNPEHGSAKDYWNDYLMQEELKSMISGMRDNSNYCRNLFVWLNGQDKVIDTNSSMSYELYSQIVCQNNEEWSGDIKKAIVQIDQGKIVNLHSEKDEYIVLLEPILGIGVKKGDAATGIWVDIDALNHKINASFWDGGMDWMLLDNQGNILRYPTQFDPARLNTQELLSNESLSIDINDKSYLAEVKESDFYDLKYILFTPKEMINMPANKIRMLNLSSLFIVLIVGCAVTTFFIKMQYHPLNNLLQMIKDREEEPIENEYEYLEKKVAGIMQKNIATENENRTMIRKHALERLIVVYAGEETSSVPAVAEQERLIYEKFWNGSNIVLISYEKNMPEAADEILKEERLKRYVIQNVLDEGIGELFQQDTFEYDKRIITIINIPETCKDYTKILQEETERLRNFVTQNFHFSFCTLEGGIHEGLEGVKQSWLEACQAEEFINDLEEMYIRYEEVRDRSVYRYLYSFDVEESIVNAIRNGNSRSAQVIIDQIVEKCFNGKNNAISEMQTCMLYDMLGTLIKAAEEQSINIINMPYLKLILSENNAEKLQQYFYEIIEEICSQLANELEEKQGNKLSEDIFAYIHQSYADPDLNISQIAYRFHMTPAWISSTFKKQTGRSLLNVIKQVRIENARRLLNEGFSVVEVSQMVGFRESTTFIRTFKGCTGVTPGQLRKVNKNESD